MDLAALYEKLSRHVAGEIVRDEPLAARVSVRVGGPADLFVRPADAESLCTALAILADAGAPWTVLGGGANTIFGDGGVRGAVVKLPSSGPERVEAKGGAVEATLFAGAPIARLIEVMRAHRAVGAEALAGVPGTLGGAVAMNAGTKNGSVQQVLASVELATASGLRSVPASELGFAYRSTRLPERSVVLAARFRLSQGDVEASEARMADDLAYRRRTQPLNLPNSGSVFMNPPGLSAGRLIEEAGLKGRRAGNAQISELHANFVVNLGGARAHDVKALIELARAEVGSRTGIALQTEVKLVGEF